MKQMIRYNAFVFKIQAHAYIVPVYLLVHRDTECVCSVHWLISVP